MVSKEFQSNTEVKVIIKASEWLLDKENI